MACWIALLQSKKVILAGDHLQLPPTILSVEAAGKGLGLTLMERAIEILGHDVVRMLNIQYRMNNGELSSLPTLTHTQSNLFSEHPWILLVSPMGRSLYITKSNCGRMKDFYSFKVSLFRIKNGSVNWRHEKSTNVKSPNILKKESLKSCNIHNKTIFKKSLHLGKSPIKSTKKYKNCLFNLISE